MIAFDNRGLGASTGNVPGTVEAMADDAYTFITALGYDTVDIFSFSLGGMVAQALVVKHPRLVRKLILTGTGPAGGKDMDKVAGVTYADIARAALSRKDPKEFLFFNRNSAGKPAAKAFVERLEGAHRGSRQEGHRQGVPDPADGDQAVGAIDPGRPVDDHPADADRQW